MQIYSDGLTSTRPPVENEAIPHPRVFVQISKEPLFTIGKQSFLTEMIARAGGAICDCRGRVQPIQSSVRKRHQALDPEIIILSESDDNREPNDVFKNSPAVKNGRIYKVNADILSRPGPRLVDALEQISKSFGLTVAR